MLADLTGRSEEEIELETGSNSRELVDRISAQYEGFADYDYNLAVNMNLIHDPVSLEEMDEIAFLPPYAGG